MENNENNLRFRLFKEDVRTGEVVEEANLEEYDIIDKEKARRAKEQREARSKKYFEGRTGDAFVWAVYKLSSSLMADLSAKYVSMLFYLATYTDYKGYLSTGKKLINKKQLPKILRVSDTTAFRFWKALNKAGIAKEDAEGKLSLDEQYFRRGYLYKRVIAVSAEQNMYFSRAYVRHIRDVYENADSGSRNTLGYLFQMLPFVNREFNIVCHNPEEADMDKVLPMTFGEVCEAIGYDPENANRLLRELLKITFCADGQKPCGIVGFGGAKNPYNITGFKLFVNPCVFYAGSQENKAKILKAFYV